MILYFDLGFGINEKPPPIKFMTKLGRGNSTNKTYKLKDC
tara:strand:+ start:3422 stop:3541 length:120 start_codon:yes stop_codon:yes gene_type:complete